MKKIYYTFLSIILLIPAFAVCKESKIESDSLVFICNELLGRPTDNSVTIHACVNKSLEVYYEYGTDSLHYSSQTNIQNTNDSIPFVFKLDKLSPDTQYFYRLRYKESGKTDFSTRNSHFFHTQRKNGENFTFAIEADPHLDTNSIPAAYALTLQNILSKKPDFMIDLGDNFMSEKLPVINHDEILKRILLLRSYYDLICHSIPLFLVIGNHEGELGWMLDGTDKSLPVMTSNLRNLYYPNPIPDSAFYTGNTKSENFVGLRANYYSWEWGNALFVVIDPYWYTVKKPGWGWTLGADQYNWFKNTLTTSKAKFKFVFCHQLVGGDGNDGRGGVEFADFFEMGGKNSDSTWGFDKNRPGWGNPIHQLMVEYGVNIYFHGHDHFYDKQIKDGIIYQEVPQPSSKNINSTQAANYGYLSGVILPSRGYLLLSINDSIAKVDYIRTYFPTEEKGKVKNGDIADSYIIKKTGSTDAGNSSDLSNEFILNQNYPNPFNFETFISYTLPQSDYVQLKITDMSGKEICAVVNQYQNSGTYSITINSDDLKVPNGIYFYQLITSKFSETREMIIAK